ncbi:hypothetical protein [Streptomyces sp. NPDC005141]
MTQLLSGARFLAADAYSPPVGADTILGILAWCASAAGVAGLIVVGIQMALQLRRGDPGEGGEHFRGVFFVTLGCLVATTAGPLVAALGALSLLGP